MPKDVKALGFRASRPAIKLPLRMEEQTERYSRVYVPGPIDRWLTDHVARSDGSVDSGWALAPDEVHCKVQLERVVSAPDPDPKCPFQDFDMNTVYLTVGVPKPCGFPGELQFYPRVVLQSYRGEDYMRDAPNWMKWEPGRTVTFRETKAKLAELFVQAALEKNCLAPFIKGFECLDRAGRFEDGQTDFQPYYKFALPAPDVPFPERNC